MKGGLGRLKKKCVFKNSYLSATHYDGSIIASSLHGGPACSQGAPLTWELLLGLIIPFPHILSPKE